MAGTHAREPAPADVMKSDTGDTGETEPAHALDSPTAGRSAVRGSALLSVGYVAGLGLSLVSAPLLTRHLGAVGLGRYTTVISLVAIVIGLTEGGINSIALREYAARSGHERDMVMRDLTGLRIVLSLLTALVAVALAIGLGYSNTLVIGTAIAVAGQVLLLFRSFLGTSLQGNLRFGWITALEFAGQLATVTLIVAFVLAGASLVPFFVVPAAAALLTLPFMLGVTRGLMPLRPAFRPARWLPLVKATIPFAMAIAVSVLYFRFALIATSLLSTKYQTGYFSASFRVVEVLVGVPSLAAGAGFPILARAVAQQDDARLHYAARRLIEALFVLGVLLSMSLVLAAKFIIDVLGATQYAHSVPVLRIQGLALMATCVAVGSGYVLLALHRHRAILIANLVALTTSLVFSVILIPSIGAQGAALAALLAELGLASAEVTMLARTRPNLLRPLSRRLATILSFGALGSAALLIPGLPSIAAWALGTLVFVLLLTATGHLPPEVRELLHRSPRRQEP